ncbi:hypothetical protein [Haloechinothrix aidingensis]|uniref:hypothetical protein n=1 Tax=Haloechinothrix aidingensis TaxID=2752311 RepID=UPI0015DF8174|nr:hypothetical protein [Haloechinothrix aidingensis]
MTCPRLRVTLRSLALIDSFRLVMNMTLRSGAGNRSDGVNSGRASASRGTNLAEQHSQVASSGGDHDRPCLLP